MNSRASIWAGIIALAITMAPANHAAAQEPVQPLVISQRSEDNRAPAICATPDGSRLFVAWDGVVAGARRIILRERIDGAWLPEQIIDQNPSAGKGGVVAAVDDLLNPHLVWCETSGGSSTLQYATRVAGSWLIKSVPHAGTGNCEEPVMRIVGGSQPWIAFQQGSGLNYRVLTATLPSGASDLALLDPGFAVAPINVYPDFITLEGRLALVWYAADGPNLTPVASTFDEQTSSWQLTDLAFLAELPVDRFPRILSTGSPAGLHAVWFDRASGSDRIVLASSSISSATDPEVVATAAAEGGLRELSGQPDTGSGAVVGAWAMDDPDGRNQVAGFIIGATEVTTTPLTAPSAVHWSRPAAVDIAGTLAATWESDPAAAGSGLIYFSETSH